ncbi:MAG TPA: hypothetical protein VEZ13_10705 [Brevibacillus sp.]|nr:hypothetical protein [Brevibacillus sp.]
MQNITKNEMYAFAVNNALMDLFDPDSENHQFTLDEVDATEFFIGLVKGCGMVYNKLTGDQKNFLQFTHLCNQLIVQDMLAKKGE